MEEMFRIAEFERERHQGVFFSPGIQEILLQVLTENRGKLPPKLKRKFPQNPDWGIDIGLIEEGEIGVGVEKFMGCREDPNTHLFPDPCLFFKPTFEFKIFNIPITRKVMDHPDEDYMPIVYTRDEYEEIKDEILGKLLNF